MNLRKHGVRFSDAVLALEDDLALTNEDDSAEGERRFVTLGIDDSGRLLVVVWTGPRNEAIRIISARRATRKECKAYEG